MTLLEVIQTKVMENFFPNSFWHLFKVIPLIHSLAKFEGKNTKGICWTSVKMEILRRHGLFCLTEKFHGNPGAIHTESKTEVILEGSPFYQTTHCCWNLPSKITCFCCWCSVSDPIHMSHVKHLTPKKFELRPATNSQEVSKFHIAMLIRMNDAQDHVNLHSWKAKLIRWQQDISQVPHWHNVIRWKTHPPGSGPAISRLKGSNENDVMRR